MVFAFNYHALVCLGLLWSALVFFGLPLVCLILPWQKYTTSFFIWIVGFMWDIMIFDILCGINVGSYVKSLCVGR